MLFRQLFDATSSTYTYLLADETSREAVIIDPVLEQVERDVALITELGLRLVYSIDTHVHADHVTANGSLRHRLGAKTVLSERAGTGCPDILVKDGDVIRFGACGLEVIETPGHTSGCLTYVTLDRAMAFTGDALLIRGCGRTDFQGGSARTLFHSIHDKLFTLPATTLLYPGHDYLGRTVTTVDEERRLNPRLGGGKTEAEFVAIMEQLNLAYPKKIDIALPRNQACGFDPVSLAPIATPAWAPVEVTATGIPELAPEWLHEHLETVTVVDVRGADELAGPLAKLPAARAIAPDQLAGSLAELPRDTPIVIVCRSGGRSGKAAIQLAQLGFTHVASLRGGMTSWHQTFGVTMRA